ncbi:Uncharacterized protein dnm_034890 [Desulfonema magnum]|uniref:Uncharacterized protein n=1 Tax=Desulfonema magnum TaxID=45655 RepID=A0A975BL56_9BACT|nr:Uncharacterized protein dnm_034890 [Desulfonema magnum]
MITITRSKKFQHIYPECKNFASLHFRILFLFREFFSLVPGEAKPDLPGSDC